MRGALDFLLKLMYYLAYSDYKSQRKVTFMLQFRINTFFNNANASYGIDVIDKQCLIRQYTDLSDNFEELQKLIELCNSLDIEECHIDDIIEDFLTDFKT